MSALPDGVLTFLFSDIEDSTRLAARLGDEQWSRQLEIHRGLVRECLGAHAGHEVDAQGDAFFAVFRRATDAVACATAMQRALADHAWPEDTPIHVRVGLHTGEAALGPQGYVGQEVHRGSRICDAGHGGQILLSQTTADLVREGLARGVSLADLGVHRLKGLDTPQRLHQLQDPELRTGFPALRALAVGSNLPAERTSFVGRTCEIERLERSLEEHPAVTLTGIGGSGKTRLALRVASRSSARFADGAFFVDLAPVADPDLLPQTVASALDIALFEGPGTSGDVAPEVRLVDALALRECLLLIDNCEHMLDAVADLVDRIVENCPGVTVLATSREALGIEGEQVTRVPSLSLPEDPATAEASEAVALFVQRAESAKPGFVLDDETRGPVIEICRRLDGIPLAIEFAGARVAHLSPRQIADRLEDRFRLLTGGRRRIQRQQTLAAALDWSHDMLGEEERALFRRLATFAGSFGIDAVESICADDAMPTWAALDTLASLVAKSLVTAEAAAGGEARYRLLESVRMYAAEKLADAGEAEALRGRHRDWYVSWLESMPLEELIFSPEGHPATSHELENLRAAADWCSSEDRPDLLIRILFPLQLFWTQLGAHEEGARRMREVLKGEARLSPEALANAYAVLGNLENLNLRNEGAFEHAGRVIELAEGRPTPAHVMALALRSFSSSVSAAFPGADPRHAADTRRDSDAAIALSQQGLSIEWRGWAEYWRALSETNIGDFEAAVLWFRALDRTVEASCHRQWLRPAGPAGLAVALHLLDRPSEALEAAQRMIDLGDDAVRGGVGSSPLEVTPALAAAGEEEEARRILQRAARSLRRSGVPLSANQAFCVAAVLDYLAGNLDRAGRLMAASRYQGEASQKTIPFRTPGSMSLYRHYLPRVREALGTERGRRARDEGRALTLDEAWAEVFA